MSYRSMEVVGQAIGLVRRHLFKVAAIHLFFVALAAALLFGIAMVSGSSVEALAVTKSNPLLAMGTSLATNMLMLAAMLASASIMAEDALGEHLPFFEAVSLGIRRAPAALFASVLAAIPFLLIIPGVGVFAGTSSSPLIGVLGLLLLVGLLLMFCIALSPLHLVVALEGRSLSALSRSLELTKGSRWKIFGAMLLVMMISIGFILLALIVAYLVVGSVGVSANMGGGVVIAIIAVYALSLLVVSCFGIAFQAANYAHLYQAEDSQDHAYEQGV